MLSFRSASISEWYFACSIITVALPLSTGRSIIDLFCCSLRKASRSSLVRLHFYGFDVRSNRATCCLMDSVFVGQSLIMVSTLQMTSSAEICLGVTAQLKSFGRTLMTAWSRCILSC